MTKELLIFGAFGGLGTGITKTFLKKDYDHIYLFDFNIKDKAIKQDNVTNIEIKDLSKEENVIQAFEQIKPSENKQFFLYTTVGGFAGGNKLWETDLDEWNKMMDMNFKSNFFIAKHFAKLVEQSNAGSICFTAAFVALEAEKSKAAYGASKAALVHMVETLSKEGEEIRLTANAIAPYIIDTPANRKWMKNADFDKWMKPNEIGELAHSIFSNFYFITNNILQLTSRFSNT